MCSPFDRHRHRTVQSCLCLPLLNFFSLLHSTTHYSFAIVRSSPGGRIDGDTMDIQTLYNLFQATFQPDANVRMQAELQLKQVFIQEHWRGRAASRAYPLDSSGSDGRGQGGNTSKSGGVLSYVNQQSPNVFHGLFATRLNLSLRVPSFSRLCRSFGLKSQSSMSARPVRDNHDSTSSGLLMLDPFNY